MALKEGLLSGNNLLIVAGTTSGKTLIGEIAGATSALKKKKFLYLSPLVALTNQKYEQFKKRYKKLGLKTAVRVGMSRIKVEGEFSPIIDDDYKQADIIVATYEALDFLLRDGKANELNEVGVIVIDEIQMLISKERGYRLNGLIARLKALFPSSQFIYLSATIGNPEELAIDLDAKLVKYLDRPIPLERHTILTE
ncbi:MAG: DEAD/DEAH box helicase, partial [Candidatus Heimdallarchaeaceae archaeon]